MNKLLRKGYRCVIKFFNFAFIYLGILFVFDLLGQPYFTMFKTEVYYGSMFFVVYVILWINMPKEVKENV